MFRKFRLAMLLWWGLCAAVIFGMAGGCSREHYKADADEEVYKIIDSKWQGGFGQKANYKISDVPPSPDDVQIERTVPQSGSITLAEAVATATAQNREYQRQKESLYLTALKLTGTRHKYARQWFGTIDGGYSKGVDQGGNEYEDVSVDAGSGFDQLQLLGEGVLVSTGIAIDWVRFLSGDPRTSLGSVLSGSLTAPLPAPAKLREKT